MIFFKDFDYLEIFINMSKSITGTARSVNLQRLEELTSKLTKRDEQLSRDLELFEDFFSNFPIPVTMWSIGKDYHVLSKRGNAFTCEKANTLYDIFDCSILRDKSIKKHEQALRGEKVTYFVRNESKLYWTKLVPRYSHSGEIIGVIGIAWDVTNNAIMVHHLEEILKASLGGDTQFHKECQSAASSGLEASRLKHMLEAYENDHGGN